MEEVRGTVSHLEAFARKCALWGDEYLLEQYSAGPANYIRGDYFDVIKAEVARRGYPAEYVPPSPAPVPAPASGPYFERLVRGEVSLAETYWGWGVGVGVVLAFLIKRLPDGLPVAGYMLVLSALIAYRAVIYLAVWRSAGHYKGPAIWAVLAKAAVVVGILLTVMTVVTAF